MTKEERESPYLIFMLITSFLALALLAATVLVRLDEGTKEILAYADNGICVLFGVDFIISLARAERRWKYFLRWGWLDLVSSIPAVGLFRLGRAARVLRIVRVLRGVRSTRILAGFVLRRRAESAVLAVSLIAFLLVVIGSIGILHLETTPEANIKTPEDALWWAIVTMSTVGYGDRYPVTTEGRALAAVLIAAGVGLFGTLSGFVAAWFLEPARKRQSDEFEALRGELEGLRRDLESQRSLSKT